MKKNLLFLFAWLTLASLYGQNNLVNQYSAQINSAKQQIQQILQKEALIDEFVVCQEIYEWDTVLNQFNSVGDGTLSYEEMGNIKRFTIQVETIEDGEVFNFKAESYFSFQDPNDFQTNVFGDSVLTYLGAGEGNFELLTREIYYYDNEVLVRSEGFTNYDLLGLPLGFIKTDETWYKYDNNGYLVEQVSESFDFATMELTFADSIVYVNNNDGLPVRETGYQASFFTQEIEPYFRTEYTYVNQSFVETELNYSYVSGTWIKSGRYSYTYDNNDRRLTSLQEISDDNGATWEPTRRSQLEYNEELPLGLPTSDLTQEYVNATWRNETLTTAEECSSGLYDNKLYEITAWLNDGNLYLENVTAGFGTVRMYDLSGRRVFHKSYQLLPDVILVDGLLRGIYILQIEQEGQVLTKKLFN